MANKSKLILRLGFGFFIVAFALYYININNIESSSWDLILNQYWALFGWIFLIGISFIYLLSQSLDMLRNIAFSSFIGIGFSAIIGYMYNNSIYFDTIIIGDNLLWEIQLIIVLMWLFIGIIKGATSNE